jgi:hypothetical protein
MAGMTRDDIHTLFAEIARYLALVDLLRYEATRRAGAPSPSPGRADSDLPGTLTDSIKAAGPFSIQSNKTFSLVGTGSGFTILVNGTFDAAGTGVTGTFKIHDSFDYQGVHYECDTGNDAWSAKLQG